MGLEWCVCVFHPQIILVHSLISGNENLCAQQSAILSNACLHSTIFVTETSYDIQYFNTLFCQYTFLTHTIKQNVLLCFNLPYTAF